MLAQQRVPIGDQEGVVGGEVALSRRAPGKPRLEACQEVVDLGRRPPTQLGPVELMESVVAHPVRSIPRCPSREGPSEDFSTECRYLVHIQDRCYHMSAPTSASQRISRPTPAPESSRK